MVHGILVLDKPAGKTSHDLVGWCRRLFQQKRVGHTGTLDPMATGVLPLCLGEATRLAEYLTSQKKTYVVDLRLGYVSDTYDAEGVILETSGSFEFDSEAIDLALASFHGHIKQKPPLYSAISINGQRLHRLARAGVAVDVPSRPVEITRLTLESPASAWGKSDVITLMVQCSKGTYIRSLVHDIGQLLGCGAYVCGLRRVQSGAMDIKTAATCEEIEQALAKGAVADTLLHPLIPEYLSLPWREISESEAREISFGRPVSFSYEGWKSAPSTWQYTRDVLLVRDSKIRAIGRIQFDSSIIKPAKVFTQEIFLRGE